MARHRRLRPIAWALCRRTAGGGGDGDPPTFPEPLPSPLSHHPTGPAVAGGTAADDPAGMAAQLREVGFCMLPEAIPSPALPALRAAATRTAHEHRFEQADSVWAEYLVQCKGSFYHGDLSLAPYVATPRLLAVLEAAFGSPGVGAVTTTAQVNLPGLPMHTWHPDDPGSALDPPQGEGAERWPGSEVLRPRMINVLFFLSDFTPENGGSNPPASSLLVLRMLC